MKKNIFLPGIFIFLIGFFTLIPLTVIGQYQLSNNPLRMNPSSAGSKSGSRIAGTILASSQKSYENYSRNVNHYFFSYDTFIKAIRSGIGAYYSGGVMNNRGDFEYYKYKISTLGLCVAPKLTHSTPFPQLTFSPSLGIEWINYKLKFGFNDLENISAKKNIIALRGGLLLNAADYFAGINIKYLPTNKHYYFFSGIHGGYVFQKTNKSKFSCTPSVSIMFVNSFGVADGETPSGSYFFVEALTINCKYKKIVFGGGLPNLMVGFQNTGLRICINYNFFLAQKNNFFDGNTSLPNIQVSAVYAFKRKTY